MSIEQFKKPQFRIYNSPFHAYNELFNPKDFVRTSDKDNNVFKLEGRDVTMNGAVLFKYLPDQNKYQLQHTDNEWECFENGQIYEPCQLLIGIKYKGNYHSAQNFILFEYLDKEVPYFRIGTKYFKKVKKETRYGIMVDEIVLWSKEAIIDDYGKGFLKRILRFHGFTCRPDNINYEPMHKGFYNMYNKFPHKPVQRFVTLTDIPTISGLINHIFGEQQELGYQYLKVLYEMPRQILPVLCLVSKSRQSGKSTFLNFLQILFGSNFGVINSETLTSQFNSSYAHLNIIGIDETVIEKSAAVEKIKMIATAETIPVNMKNVNIYQTEFFGKVILATNKETDFMRIDSEEIRFWIRKPEPIKRIDPNYMTKLTAEIPHFIRYLEQIEMPEFKTRMVFAPEDLHNDQLQAVKEESKSSLYKEIKIHIKNFFYADENKKSFQATPTDIKKFWFENDSRTTINYISKVLRDEMGLTASGVCKYNCDLSHSVTEGSTKTGRPYTFLRSDYVTVTDSVTDNSISVSDKENYNLGGENEEAPF